MNKMKYAIIPIYAAGKQTADSLDVPYALISYRSYIDFVFYGTHFVECNKTDSLKYRCEFFDSGYRIIRTRVSGVEFINMVRPYHYNPTGEEQPTSFLFEANNDKEAKKIFLERFPVDKKI